MTTISFTQAIAIVAAFIVGMLFPAYAYAVHVGPECRKKVFKFIRWAIYNAMTIAMAVSGAETNHTALVNVAKFICWLSFVVTTIHLVAISLANTAYRDDAPALNKFYKDGYAGFSRSAPHWLDWIVSWAYVVGAAYYGWYVLAVINLLQMTFQEDVFVQIEKHFQSLGPEPRPAGCIVPEQEEI